MSPVSQIKNLLIRLNERIFSMITRPILGGVLSRPANTWPDTFGKLLFFHQHPYFLPCGVVALVALMTGLFASVGLEEVGYYLGIKKSYLMRCRPSRQPSPVGNKNKNNSMLPCRQAMGIQVLPRVLSLTRMVSITGLPRSILGIASRLVPSAIHSMLHHHFVHC
jgi:hypothetical protein